MLRRLSTFCVLSATLITGPRRFAPANPQLWRIANGPSHRTVATRYKSISAGGSNTCAISVDDVTYCWGINVFGQIGDGTTTPRATPTPVGTTIVFTTVKISGYHACGLSGSGQAYCWGANT